MVESQVPEEPTADYANTGVSEAIAALQAEPNYAHLATFLLSLREGQLVVDVTGTSKKKATRARTIRSTTGQLILPIFTSMAELRGAAMKDAANQVKGAMMTATDALRLIYSDQFVAAQFDAGSAALVVLRKYIELALSGSPIDANAVETLR